MNLAQGKIVLALEGGYNLDSIASSMLACAELLLDGRTVNKPQETYPFESTWQVIQAVSSHLFFSPFHYYFTLDWLELLLPVNSFFRALVILQCFCFTSIFSNKNPVYKNLVLLARFAKN